jgi:calcineurin-like phosphoesterase family protein
MEAFVATVNDKHMRQRLSDALNGRKPFANFNHLVHTTSVREQWFDFKNRTYMEMAKEWIEDNASEGLKEKINLLPAVRLSE